MKKSRIPETILVVVLLTSVILICWGFKKEEKVNLEPNTTTTTTEQGQADLEEIIAEKHAAEEVSKEKEKSSKKEARIVNTVLAGFIRQKDAKVFKTETGYKVKMPKKELFIGNKVKENVKIFGDIKISKEKSGGCFYTFSGVLKLEYRGVKFELE